MAGKYSRAKKRHRESSHTSGWTRHYWYKSLASQVVRAHHKTSWPGAFRASSKGSRLGARGKNDSCGSGSLQRQTVTQLRFGISRSLLYSKMRRYGMSPWSLLIDLPDVWHPGHVQNQITSYCRTVFAPLGCYLISSVKHHIMETSENLEIANVSQVRSGPINKNKKRYFLWYILYNNFNGLSNKGNLWNENCNACSEDQKRTKCGGAFYARYLVWQEAQKGGNTEIGLRRPWRYHRKRAYLLSSSTWPMYASIRAMNAWCAREKQICPIDDDFSSVYDTLLSAPLRFPFPTDLSRSFSALPLLKSKRL